MVMRGIFDVKSIVAPCPFPANGLWILSSIKPIRSSCLSKDLGLRSVFSENRSRMVPIEVNAFHENGLATIVVPA
jgi:hypothetical protein